ncbi:uncharacterized protein LOC128849770 isoform X2 [Cuculus canorus]|uniref:uncharacterized protein LOC128849770 isoform X2 n=1 Tax=Cuculus canorus TaxID=55661 RepID=UPI0023AA9253|nr:uncharacterized protein LOC128849770 isoform X2 [Cuculus canorus]
MFLQLQPQKCFSSVDFTSTPAPRRQLDPQRTMDPKEVWSWRAQRCLWRKVVRRSWWVKAARCLLLLSWLAGAGGTELKACSSPGDFSPPALFLNISSAQEGDEVLARCLVFSRFPIAHIFFCKDGVELANHPVGKGQFVSVLSIRFSSKSSGAYSCGYRRRSSLGQVMVSRLSIPWHLEIGGGKDDLRNSTVPASLEPSDEGLGTSLTLAIVIFSFLALVLGLQLLLEMGKRPTSLVNRVINWELPKLKQSENESRWSS